jgi:phenylpyruvate tautomerase PptA (4-oxalocrotonate tautomerase family)
MALYAGKENDYKQAGQPGIDSLANEIEGALETLLTLDVLKKSDVKQRQKLVLAIARGVIEHLRKNQSAFTVTIPNNPEGKTVAIAIAVTP